jgi:hypothetical protein
VRICCADAASEGLAMAELDVGDRIGLRLTRECIFLFGSDGKRIAAATAIRAQLARTPG